MKRRVVLVGIGCVAVAAVAGAFACLCRVGGPVAPPGPGLVDFGPSPVELIPPEKCGVAEWVVIGAQEEVRRGTFTMPLTFPLGTPAATPLPAAVGVEGPESQLLLSARR